VIGAIIGGSGYGVFWQLVNNGERMYWRFYNRRWALIFKASRRKVQRADEYRERVRNFSVVVMVFITLVIIGIIASNMSTSAAYVGNDYGTFNTFYTS
jgi:hypothetical protein